ncbi:DUF6356 family protein [Brevundimonas sp.]|uniref:DUF6356 family protein n=1 Tax=Brevundimonas sp. TaxID=1871086 RepID=UPI002ED7CF0B
MLKDLFTEHPKSVGETYFEHMGMAASFGAAMFIGAAACFVHALIPGLCVRTGSGVVTDLHHRMVTHRTKSAAANEVVIDV